MRSRSLLIVFAVLIAFLVAISTLYTMSEHDPASPATQTESLDNEVLRLESSGQRNDAMRVAQPASVGVSAQGTTGRAVAGMVYVREQDGRRMLAPDGSLSLEVWREGHMQTRLRSVSVRDGAWSTEIEPGNKLVTSTFTSARGRFGRAQRLELTSSEAGATCDVVVDWEKGITLRCLDARTSRELIDVEVRVISAGTENLQFHPPDFAANDTETGQRVFTGNSPLELPCFGLPMRGWARAPGTTWRSFSFSGCAGERVLYLEAGGALEVVVPDVHLSSEVPWVSVWDCSRSPAERVEHAKLAPSGRVRFDDLPARELFVCLIRGGERCGNVLDVVTATVIPGVPTVVACCVECDGARSRTGTIGLEIVGETSTIQSITAEVADGPVPQLGAQRVTRSDAAGEPYPRWIELGRFVPGRHRIDMNPAIASAEMLVVAGQQHRLSLSGQASRKLSVTVVDRESGTVLAHAGVNARLRAGQSAGQWIIAPFDPSEQIYTTTLGAGDVALVVSLDGYESVSLTIADADVAAGARVALGRGSRYPVRIELEDAGSGVGFPPAAWKSGRIAAVPPCTGRALRQSFGSDGDGIAGRVYMEWQVNQPGRYEITWPRFDGYELLDKHEIEVTSTNAGPIVVQLVPARR